MVIKKEHHADLMKEAIEALNRDNYEEALTILKPLVRAKDPQARCILGFMHSLGLGTAIDYERAIKILADTAHRGSATAAHYLTWVYENGTPAPIDNEKAGKYQDLALDNVTGSGTTHFGWIAVEGSVFLEEF